MGRRVEGEKGDFGLLLFCAGMMGVGAIVGGVGFRVEAGMVPVAGGGMVGGCGFGEVAVDGDFGCGGLRQVFQG